MPQKSKKTTKSTKHNNSSDEKNIFKAKSKIFVFLLVILLASLVIKVAANSASEQMNLKYNDFNENNIILEPISELKADFVETNTSVDNAYEFYLSNNSNYTYSIELVVSTDNNESKKTKYVNFEPNERKRIKVTVPIIFPEEERSKKNFLTHLTFHLKTRISTSEFLPKKNKEFSTQFNVINNIYNDNELVSLDLGKVSPDTIDMNSDHKLITYEIYLFNLTPIDIQNAYYKTVLIDSVSGEEIQPLEVKQIELKPGSSRTEKGKFEFKLPPANLMEPGEKTYKIKIEFTGTINSRMFKVSSKSTNSIKIKMTEFK